MATGDRQALQRLYKLTSERVFAILMRILRDRSDAEDALQNVYIKAWRGAPSFDVTRNGEAWLATIARNVAIDSLRQSRKRLDENGELDMVADPARSTSTIHQIRADLRSCLATLDQAHATAVLQVYLYGLSYQDVADTLGTPLNTVRTWLRRSLLKLRECLESADDL